MKIKGEGISWEKTLTTCLQTSKLQSLSLSKCTSHHVKAPQVISLKDTDELPFVYQKHVDLCF